jgi:hypothetical protein
MMQMVILPSLNILPQLMQSQSQRQIWSQYVVVLDSYCKTCSHILYKHIVSTPLIGIIIHLLLEECSPVIIIFTILHSVKHVAGLTTCQASY